MQRSILNQDWADKRPGLFVNKRKGQGLVVNKVGMKGGRGWL
jgi:hypothetical protein